MKQRDMTFIKADGTGVPVWYMNPERTPLELDDFYTPLTNICRYNGAIRWTLLRHLALGIAIYDRRCPIALTVPRQQVFAYYAAHDLHECIVGDVVSGMKKHMPEFNIIEEKWEQHVHDQIGLPLSENKFKGEVKGLDLLALLVEMKSLNHPAYEIARENIGMEPTAQDMEAFQLVSSMEPEMCFTMIKKAIETVRNKQTWQSN